MLSFSSFKKVSQLFGIGITLLFLSQNTTAQTISFSSSGLVGENVLNPTSLDFGPDDRLYVSQQNGLILAYTIERDNAPAGNGTYTATQVEEITAIRLGVPNHTDSGSFNPNKQRLVTGILAAGTASNPILYVNSSDYLLGGGAGGNDSNLDTNSGVLSKLEWTGTEWHKIDLIRGFARCEENHAIEGLDMFEKDGNTYILLTVGGNTNKGAPSNNFAGTPEYMTSGSVFIVNLTQLENMPVYVDPRTNTEYIYDLPTINDPTRIDIDNTHSQFPYPPGHPMHNATIDLGDPFGGNNGLNQAFLEPGAPIEAFSRGYRNAYDVVVTESGRIYLSDNGPNGLWGGLPKIYNAADDTFLGDQSTIPYDPVNHYVTGEFNETGSSLHGDPLHYVGTINDANGTYYGGHPLPIVAFPSRAKVIAYDPFEASWDIVNANPADQLLENLILGVSGYFNTSFDITDFPDDPRLGEYLLDEPVGSSKVNILDVINASTNGICEYTASNFGGIMQGNILTASFNGNINRYVLNATGDAVVEHDITFTGFGQIPLDVIALGDEAIFPGSVWAATYGSNAITVFEPTDLNCLQPGDVGFDPLADYDGDGYTNQDEIDNDKNLCSQSSKPTDNDGDFISDLNDDDDDNDGILDVNDAFALDANNGLTTNLPIAYPFWNNDPGTGFLGLGFTGLMLDPSGTTDYLTQFDLEDLSFGGAAGKATLDIVTGGDALEANNDLDNGFQFGINVDTNSNPFTIQTKVESPFFGINGSQTSPVDFQSYGISFGTGDQDNYLKLVLMNGTVNNDGVSGLQVLLEDNGVVTLDDSYDIPNILNASAVVLYVTIDPSTNSAQPFYSIDNGQTLSLLGSPITLPSSFLDPLDNKGLAVGFISTSRSSSGSNPFTATWDYIEVYENQNGVLEIEPNTLDFGLTPITNSRRTKFLTLKNEGGPIDSDITVTGITFSGTDATLFESTADLPLVIGPGASIKVPIDFISDGIVGEKNATIEVTHNGSNSPVSSLVTGELTDIFTPVVRINAGGPEVIATDGGPDWEANNATGTTTGENYAVTSGFPFSVGIGDMPPYSERDASVPGYIDEDTYFNLFRYERGESPTTFQMIFSIAIPNGDYILNYYGTNIYNGTSDPGERIFSINVEGERRIEHLDLSARFGHRIGGMIQNNVTVTDGELEIVFFREVGDPIISAIEVLGVEHPPIQLTPIADIMSCENDPSDFGMAATSGNPNENFTYELSGQPAGIDIEPTNGLIFGFIDPTAITGGPNNDGVHVVTAKVTKPGNLPVETTFTWTVVEDIEAPTFTCPEAIITHVAPGETEATVTITTPTATDNCSSSITVSGMRSDALALTAPYPIGETTITWTATDGSSNTSVPCEQIITVVEAAQLSLSVSLQGRSDYSGDYSVIIFSTSDLVNPVYSGTESASTLGEITLPTSIALGTYKVLVKHPMYLQRAIDVTLTADQAETVPVLLAGDVNNDNSVNILDYGLLSGSFFLNDGDPGYDNRADFNNDNSINILDYGLLSGNFFINGETQND